MQGTAFIKDGHVVLTGAPAASLTQPYRVEWASSHMADFDSRFRASDQRLVPSRQASPDSSLSDTLILDAAHNHPGRTVMVALDGLERPVFGRFQIDKPHGRGAVGVVYLGRDHAAGRMAAVKIMALPQESATGGGTGKLPFQGRTLARLLSRIANEPHTDILSCNPALPPSLAEIVDRALAKRLQERYQSGREMARALRACLSGPALAKKTGSADIIHRRGKSW